MTAWIRAALAVAGLGLKETLRMRLWLLAVIAGALVMVAIPGIGADTPTLARKLAVWMLSTLIGFIAVMTAILLPAAILTRDRESGLATTLSSKPLPSSAYLTGRWLGTLAAIAALILPLMAVGGLAMAWRCRGCPAPLEVQQADEAWRLDAGTAQVFQPGASLRLSGDLAQGRGEGVRWRFTGLDVPATGLRLLMRARVGTRDVLSNLQEARISVVAVGTDGNRRLLDLTATSPYGRRLGDGDPGAGAVVVRNRDRQHTDLERDYLQIRIPAEVVTGGRLMIEILRLDAGAWLGFDREDSVLIASSSGSFAADLGRTLLTVLAGSALVVALAILLAGLARTPVVLLGCLVVYFGGSILPWVRGGLELGEDGPLLRLTRLLLWLVPDFRRFDLDGFLAAGRSVPWDLVGQAWTAHGASALVLLFLAWLVRRRAQA